MANYAALPGWAARTNANAIRAVLPGWAAHATVTARAVLPGWKASTTQQALISAGSSQTVEGGQTVILDATTGFGTPPDRYIWEQVPPTSAEKTAYEATYGVAYPVLTFATPNAGGDSSYVAPGVMANLIIPIRLRGTTLAGVDVTPPDTVTHTILAWYGAWRAASLTFPYLVAELSV